MASQKKHSSHVWKTQSEMVPDKGFVRQLKMLHKSFEVVWDKGSNVWEIWDFPEGVDPYQVMRVQTKGKSYRELGTDVLLQLQKNIFFHSNFTTKEICDYLDEMDNQLQRRKERDFSNKIQAMARDTFAWSIGIPQFQVPRKFKLERVVCDA